MCFSEQVLVVRAIFYRFLPNKKHRAKKRIYYGGGFMPNFLESPPISVIIFLVEKVLGQAVSFLVSVFPTVILANCLTSNSFLQAGQIAFVPSDLEG